MFFKRLLYPSTRGNLLKIAKLPIVSERDKNCVSNRVINIWNSLPDYIIAARSIASFKRSLSQFDFSLFCINNFVSSI